MRSGFVGIGLHKVLSASEVGTAVVKLRPTGHNHEDEHFGPPAMTKAQ